MNFKPSDLVDFASYPQMRRGVSQGDRGYSLGHWGYSSWRITVEKPYETLWCTKKCSFLISSIYDLISLLSSSLLSYQARMSHHVHLGYLNLFWFNCPFLFGLALLGACFPSETHLLSPWGMSGCVSS